VTRFAFTVFTFLNLVYSIRGFVMNFVTKFLSVLGLTVVLIAPASAAILVMDGGTIKGATGVDVGGTSYDVTFGDGVVGDGISSFTESATSTSASEALRDLVFTNLSTSLGAVQGCQNIFTCQIFTPFANVIRQDPESGSSARTLISYFWFDSINSGVVSDIQLFPSSDTATSNNSTIARWSIAQVTSAVPEPETYAMFLAGLGLLGFVSRRRKQKAAV